MILSHSSALERATTATTGSVSLRLNTSCGTPGAMKMKSPASWSTRSREPVAVLVAHAAFEDVEHDLEVDVDVGAGDAARRNRRHVHRELRRADVLARHPELVADAVPVAAHAAAADPHQPVVPFDLRRLVAHCVSIRRPRPTLPAVRHPDVGRTVQVRRRLPGDGCAEAPASDAPRGRFRSGSRRLGLRPENRPSGA